MKKIISGLCILVVFCFNACAVKEPDHDPELTITDSSKSVTTTSDSLQLVTPDNNVPVSSQPLITTSPQTVVSQASSTSTASGKNPPHGQPNHRCDIEVGAPLNSPATKPVNPTVSKTTTPVVQTTATPSQKITTNTETAAGMNPPHGQAGHRCDIEVGAPLNSPVKKPVNPTVTPTPVIISPTKDSGS